MKHRYLMSVAAAALIAGGGLAHAQGTGSGGSMSGGGAAQGAGPATERGGSSVVPMNRNEPSGMKGSESAPGPNGMKSTQSDQKAGDRNQRAQDAPSGAKSDGKSERSSDSRDGSRDGSKAAKDMKAEDRNNARDSNRDAAEQGRDRNTQQHDHRPGRGRRQDVERAAQQDHHRDQAAARRAGDQRQLLDLDRHTGTARGALPPASGGDRHGLSGLAGLRVLPGARRDHRGQSAHHGDRRGARRLSRFTDPHTLQGSLRAALFAA